VRTLVAALGVVSVVTLGGCAAPGEAATSTTAPTTSGPLAPPVPLTVGTVSLTVQPTGSFTADGGTLSVTTDPDGSVRLHVTSSARTRQATATLAPPDGTTLDPLPDGSALIRSGDGTVVAGITPTKARLAHDDGTVRLSASSGGELWLTDTAVTSLDWGDREGGPSLAVTPTAWGRSKSQAAEEMVWAAVAAQPDADTRSMRDQLVCHRIGALDKATWNLEPWRPTVDSITLLVSRCNPT
jgi:hypothetical protein